MRLPPRFPLPASAIELTREARPRAYFDAVGRRAALLGFESGVFESWAFPLKLFHNARLRVSLDGADDPVDLSSLIERVIARPESTTLIASHQQFSLRATFFTPIDEAGSVILLDVDTSKPLTISVSFDPDLKPMWPGGLGGQSAGWRDDLKAFVISESRRRYHALFGSPAATRGISTPAHQLGAGGLRFEIAVDPSLARRSYYPLIIAGGERSRAQIVETYQRLAASIPELYRQTFNHYRRLREELTSIETSDQRFNLAFEWAKVALDRGMAENPDLGLGLVAGWGSSGDGARPGFGWYFGGDAAINSLALTAYGDFNSLRAIFRFFARYQRADGKITHEISQSAGTIRWFDEYPYAFLHADTTPLYIAAVYNYYRQSGDRALIDELYPVLKKAYQFCVANDSDLDGILENSRAGLGASELGSLLAGLHQDILLAAADLESSRAMIDLAAIAGDGATSETAARRYKLASESIDRRYWSEGEGRYVYALTKDGRQNAEITSWTAVPLMFRQLPPARASATLRSLAGAGISSDWGTRMISDRSPAYDPIGYNNGGVWPFLTGYVAAAEYEYGRAHSAFAHLEQLVRLSFDHALGLQPEILSGDYYRPLDESVPHQLFSSGMVVTALMRGLVGLRADAAGRKLRLAPQLPPTWNRLLINRLKLGSEALGIRIERRGFNTFRLELSKTSAQRLRIELAPALPAFARNVRVRIDGQSTTATTRASGAQTICELSIELAERRAIEITFEGGLELDLPPVELRLGDRTSSLKVLDLSARGNGELALEVEGLSGMDYPLRLRGGVEIVDVIGASVKQRGVEWTELRLDFADGPMNGYRRRQVTIKTRSR